MKRLTLLLPVLSLAGCAFLHSVTYDPLTGKRSTSATAYTIFDANSTLVKFNNRASATTNGTWAPGTSIGSLNESSSTSNLVSIIGAVAQGVAAGLK